MKIQAFVPVFCEADVLPHTLRHLHEQGCAVHVIDGWSTDGSWEIAEQASAGCIGVTCERFPATGRDSIQNCTAILKRIEDLAAESDADWCLYTDADEWRRAVSFDPPLRFSRSAAPQAIYTLSQEVNRIDAMRYNAIDFRVFQFYCIDDGWPRCGKMIDGVWHQEAMDPEKYFTRYDESDCISRIPNRKLWKNVGRVQLAGGGHEVTFPGMRVYPQKFTMKHYPFRTPEQARRKMETRLARRRMEEHAKGWGVHYDQYPPGFDFTWDPAKLLYWKDTRSPLP